MSTTTESVFSFSSAAEEVSIPTPSLCHRPDDCAWYEGIVGNYSLKMYKHQIRYDDGEKKFESLLGDIVGDQHISHGQ